MIESCHCNKSTQKDKQKSKQTTDTSKDHPSVLRAGLSTHCIVKTHSSSQKILLIETRRCLGRVYSDMYTVLYSINIYIEQGVKTELRFPILTDHSVNEWSVKCTIIIT